MQEAREKQNLENSRVQLAAMMREQHKLEAGEQIVSNATACPPHIVEGSSDDSDDCDLFQRRHAKRSTRYKQVVICEWIVSQRSSSSSTPISSVQSVTVLCLSVRSSKRRHAATTKSASSVAQRLKRVGPSGKRSEKSWIAWNWKNLRL